MHVLFSGFGPLVWCPGNCFPGFKDEGVLVLRKEGQKDKRLAHHDTVVSGRAGIPVPGCLAFGLFHSESLVGGPAEACCSQLGFWHISWNFYLMDIL